MTVTNQEMQERESVLLGAAISTAEYKAWGERMGAHMETEMDQAEGEIKASIKAWDARDNRNKEEAS